MTLQSDALLATTGLFPTGISEKEHIGSQAIPATWPKRLARWVGNEEQTEFVYVPPRSDMEKTFTKLAVPPSELEVVAWFEGIGADDVELQADYFASLMRARDYVVAIWPKFSIETAAGPQILPLSHDDAAEMWSVLQVLDDPDRIIDELESRTLTATQALAFRECYPDLYALINEGIDAALIDKRAKDDAFDLGWEREAVLNILRGKPPEDMPVPPPPPPQPAGKLKIDAGREQTQEQISGAPKPRK